MFVLKALLRCYWGAAFTSSVYTEVFGKMDGNSTGAGYRQSVLNELVKKSISRKLEN